MNKKKVTVLGAGLVGAAIALDLSQDYSVLSVDIDSKKLGRLAAKGLETSQIDLSVPENIKSCIKDADFVINAVPGFMGYETSKQLLMAGQQVMDISFFPEDPSPLEKIAVKSGGSAVIDCGVAPGMSHMQAGFAANYFDSLSKLRIYVGGLPVDKSGYWQYKAVFSPADVLEEYTRPARLVEKGQEVSREPLSGLELLDFKKAGKLEAFNTDGLRSLIRHIDCPDMAEKTLRYPGYAKKIEVLKQSGFLQSEKIKVSGLLISPLALTSGLLFSEWELKPGEHDMTVMRVFAEGLKNGINQRLQFDLIDYYEGSTGIHSMARTTGYTATATLRLMDTANFTPTGLVYPEHIGMNETYFQFILNDLSKKKITYHKTITDIDL